MVKKPQPTDAEILDMIIPVLVQSKKEGRRLTETTKPTADAILKHWPGIRIKTALAKVTRLRIL